MIKTKHFVQRQKERSPITSKMVSELPCTRKDRNFMRSGKEYNSMKVYFDKHPTKEGEFIQRKIVCVRNAGGVKGKTILKTFI